MRKAIPLAVLVMFSWLQGYQLCDASEDAVEALVDAVATPCKNPVLAALPATDDDIDAAIPMVMGQTHSMGRVELAKPVFSYLAAPLILQVVQAVPTSRAAQGRSPPYERLSVKSQRIAFFTLDRSPAQALAPPHA